MQPGVENLLAIGPRQRRARVIAVHNQPREGPVSKRPMADGRGAMNRESAPSSDGSRHLIVEPRVHYYGTPVVLVSTTNPDGSANLAPMSSAWWIGDSCLLGLDETSQTTVNLQRTSEVVLNLPDTNLVAAVDRLAGYTGSQVVPPHKAAKGYQYLADKFGRARLTPVDSHVVAPPRVDECPIQMESRVTRINPYSHPGSGVLAIEVRIVRTHVREDMLVAGSNRHIDPERWDPLLMKFTHFYGQARHVHRSRLAEAWQIPPVSNPVLDP